MDTVVVDQPVEVVDNGKRCFIPPCFNFELRGQDGTLVATVSRVVLDVEGFRGVRDFDALHVLSSCGALALGIISDYDAGPEARETGREFTIQRSVPELHNPQAHSGLQ
jgi:hypothetical protein